MRCMAQPYAAADFPASPSMLGGVQITSLGGRTDVMVRFLGPVGTPPVPGTPVTGWQTR